MRALRAHAAVVVIQLVAYAALAATGHWGAGARNTVVGAALTCAEALLVYEVARSLAGTRHALWAAGLWIAAPVLLLRFWVSGGPVPLTPFSPIFHKHVMPFAFGAEGRNAVIAACLLLLACRITLDDSLPWLATAGAAGLAAGVAAAVDPRVWPALAAPALGYLVARRPVAASSAAAGAALGLLALVLFRHVPAIGFGRHHAGSAIAQIREFSWSLRVLEYLPLAGLVGIAIRSRRGAALLGWMFFALIALPLGHAVEFDSHGGVVRDVLIAMTPGLPFYALLAAGIPFLRPRSVRQVVPERSPAV